jgi:hypothetical protein
MTQDLYVNPEPVPAASQLALLPFLAGVDGYLRAGGDIPDLRITFHRTMSRENRGYLQQACAYVKQEGVDWKGKVGRMFAVDTGIIGAAYGSGQIWRTKGFADESLLAAALKKDDLKVGARSWLSVPFLGAQNQVVLILFAECNEFNFFADDSRVGHVVAMGRGFCRLFDSLQKEPFENLRNFPLLEGKPVSGVGGVFSVQEALTSIAPPRFAEVPSFNYEASAA